jgi:hypothetical protein
MYTRKHTYQKSTGTHTRLERHARNCQHAQNHGCKQDGSHATHKPLLKCTSTAQKEPLCSRREP